MKIVIIQKLLGQMCSLFENGVCIYSQSLTEDSGSLSVCAVPQRGVVGVEAVVGTVTGCSPRSSDGVSSSGGGLFLWASSLSVSWVCSSFTGSLLCEHHMKSVSICREQTQHKCSASCIHWHCLINSSFTDVGEAAGHLLFPVSKLHFNVC